MSLFSDDDRPPQPQQRPPRRPFSLRNRSIYFWLNVGFAVVVLGLLFGAMNQPWFIVVALIWGVVNIVVAVRASRHQPPPPNLFDD
jgi:heme O synthase-like polyprenyltransferase